MEFEDRSAYIPGHENTPMDAKKTLTALTLLVLLAGCIGTQGPTDFNTQIPNPASKFCEDHGYTLKIVDDPAGQFGLCVFPDGTSCDEWAYYRGECLPGQPNVTQ